KPPGGQIRQTWCEPVPAGAATVRSAYGLASTAAPASRAAARWALPPPAPHAAQNRGGPGARPAAPPEPPRPRLLPVRRAASRLALARRRGGGLRRRSGRRVRRLRPRRWRRGLRTAPVHPHLDRQYGPRVRGASAPEPARRSAGTGERTRR